MSQLQQHDLPPDQSPLLTPSPPSHQHHSPPLAHDDKTLHEPARPAIRSALSHKHHQPHGHARHAVKPHIGSRKHSHGKNLHKLGARNHSHGENLHNLGLGILTNQPIDMAPASSSTPQRLSASRSNSKSLASPTIASPQTRPTPMKRNASGFVVPRATTHSALKKNYSSGHLPRQGSSRNVAKAARPAAPPMRRTQSSKSVSSQKSQKSPGERQGQPTVRFDLGDEDPTPDNEPEGEDDEGGEWTDSTSLSPSTTRDHTRQNSVILGNALNGSPARPQYGSGTSALSQQALPPKCPQLDKENNESSNIRRSASSHSILTPDAITSRLLMRAPSAQTLSTVNATAVGTPSFVHLSHSQASTVNEGASSGSGGTNLVSRFLAGGNSHGATSELLSRAIMSRNAHKDEESDSDGENKPLETHRRNKSASNVASIKSGSRSNAPPHVLPPSRTSQKLELQRASTMAEPSRKVPVLPSRPTAPLLLSSVNNNFGLGQGEGGSVNAHYQGLYTQIDKDYSVVRRFRRPVEEAIGRLERRQISLDVKGKGPANATNAPAQSPKKQPQELRVGKHYNGREHQPEIKSPEHLNARRSRVSFEIPSSNAVMAEDDEASINMRANAHVDPVRAEMAEICRRMWDLSNVSEPVTYG
jgi:hypothetical protein